MFHSPNMCRVKHKTKNESYICEFPFGNRIIVGDTLISQREFIREWELVEYFGELEFEYNGIVKTKFNGKPVTYT